MAYITIKQNDPKTHMTILEHNLREDFFDLSLIIHKYHNRDGSIMYMWTVLKNYPELELRQVWAFSSWPTFEEAYLEGRQALLDHLDRPDIYGVQITPSALE